MDACRNTGRFVCLLTALVVPLLVPVQGDAEADRRWTVAALESPPSLVLDAPPGEASKTKMPAARLGPLPYCGPPSAEQATRLFKDGNRVHADDFRHCVFVDANTLSVNPPPSEDKHKPDRPELAFPAKFFDSNRLAAPTESPTDGEMLTLACYLQALDALDRASPSAKHRKHIVERTLFALVRVLKPLVAVVTVVGPGSERFRVGAYSEVVIPFGEGSSPERWLAVIRDQQYKGKSPLGLSADSKGWTVDGRVACVHALAVAWSILERSVEQLKSLERESSGAANGAITDPLYARTGLKLRQDENGPFLALAVDAKSVVSLEKVGYGGDQELAGPFADLLTRLVDGLVNETLKESQDSGRLKSGDGHGFWGIDSGAFVKSPLAWAHLRGICRLLGTQQETLGCWRWRADLREQVLKWAQDERRLSKEQQTLVRHLNQIEALGVVFAPVSGAPPGSQPGK